VVEASSRRNAAAGKVWTRTGPVERKGATEDGSDRIRKGLWGSRIEKNRRFRKKSRGMLLVCRRKAGNEKSHGGRQQRRRIKDRKTYEAFTRCSRTKKKGPDQELGTQDCNGTHKKREGGEELVSAAGVKGLKQGVISREIECGAGPQLGPQEKKEVPLLRLERKKRQGVLHWKKGKDVKNTIKRQGAPYQGK